MDSIDNYINFLQSDNTFQEKPNKLPEIFRKPKASIEEWINDPYYIGEINIYPFWKNKLIDFFKNDDKRECIISGGIRGGKTFFACLIMARNLYELIYDYYTLGSVKGRFNLDDSSSVMMFMLSISLKKTFETSFLMLTNILDKSPFIKEYGQRNYNKNETLEYLNKRILISVAPANQRGVLSSDAFCVMLDESNFLKNSSDNTFEVAFNLYAEVRNRILQTFGKHGNTILVSSVDTTSSFIETRIEDRKDDPETMIIMAKNFEIRPEEYSKERFHTYIGNKNSQPFVIDLENKNKWIDVLKTLKVENVEEFANFDNIFEVKIPEDIKSFVTEAPIEFYKNAKIDILHFLKEVCGVSIGSVGNFMNNTQAFNDCINSELRHPFMFETVEVSTENAKKRNELIDAVQSGFIGNEQYDYAVSIDASKTGDSTGFTMGYYDSKLNKVVIVLQLKILPPKNPLHKIRYQTIIDFIKFLKYERKFNIRMFRCDTYQDESFLQPLSELGIDSSTISVERDHEYILFRTLILEGRIEFYDYPDFRKELFALVHDVANRRIDHTSKGSKDISDANCRLVVALVRKYDNLTKNINLTIKMLLDSRKKEDNSSMTKDQVLNIEIKNFEKQFIGEEVVQNKTMNKLLNIITRK